jgi:hypothetical protein
MSHTKLGPTLTLTENDRHESHSFWFESFKCSLKVDRRKDGQALAITLKTPEGKVVLSLGPQEAPRFVAQIKHAKPWNDACEYASQIEKNSVQFRFDYEPSGHGC